MIRFIITVGASVFACGYFWHGNVQGQFEPSSIQCETGDFLVQTSCSNIGCNDDLPCPGDCGCVRRRGQPWGTCHPYGVQ
jgi:hypothetical protein